MLAGNEEAKVDEREEAWQDLREIQRWYFLAALLGSMVVSTALLTIEIGRGPYFLRERLFGPQVAAVLYVCWPVVLFPAAAWWQNRGSSAVVLPDGAIECRRRGCDIDTPPGAVIARFSSFFPGLGVARVEVGQGKVIRVNLLTRHLALRLARVPQAGASGLDHRWVRHADGSQSPVVNRWRVKRIGFAGSASVFEPLGKGRLSFERLVTPVQLIGWYDAAPLASGESQPVGRLFSSRVGFAAMMLAMFLSFLALSAWAVGGTTRAVRGAGIPSDPAGRFDHFNRMVALGRYGSIVGLGVVGLGLVLAARTGESSPEGFTAGRRVLRRTRAYPWRGATLEIRFAGSSNRADHRLRTPKGEVVTLPLRLGETSTILRHARLGGARIEYNGEVVPPPPWLVDAGVTAVPSSSVPGAMTPDVPVPASAPSNPS